MFLGGFALAVLLAPSGEAMARPRPSAAPIRRSRGPAGAVRIRAGTRCFETVRSVAAGATLSGADIAAVPCRAERPSGRLRYDRVEGVLAAAQSLAAGTYLGPVAPLARRQIGKGATLTLRSVAGPVTIERQVTTMQAGRAGGRVFVRDASGAVFAAPLVLDDGE